MRGGSPLFDSTTSLTWSRLNMNGALTLAYKERDDARENNDSTGAATTMSFGGGDTASLYNLKLLQGDADFSSSRLRRRRTSITRCRCRASFTPTVDLLDANGTVVKRLSSTDGHSSVAGDVLSSGERAGEHDDRDVWGFGDADA